MVGWSWLWRRQKKRTERRSIFRRCYKRLPEIDSFRGICTPPEVFEPFLVKFRHRNRLLGFAQTLAVFRALPAMPQDRKKLLEALVAKRKAEAQSGENKKRTKNFSLPVPAKPVSRNQDKLKAVPLNKVKEKEKAKPKRVSKLDRYETDDDDESEEDDEEEDEATTSESDEDEEDSEDEKTNQKKSIKKPVVQSKGKTHVKGLGLGVNHKGKDEKGKGVGKDKEKLKGKVARSSDEGEDDDDDGGDLSDDSLHEVDPNNIIRSRTRRQATQPANYQYDNASSDDDDDSD